MWVAVRNQTGVQFICLRCNVSVSDAGGSTLNTSAFDVTRSRGVVAFVDSVVVESSLLGAWRWPDSGLSISTVWLSGVRGEMIHALRT